MMAGVTTWTAFAAAEPDLADRARAILAATTNCVLGTIRADGSPRLSGIDPWFTGGELHLGCMPGSRKGADLDRDPRLALHGIPWESRRCREGADDPGDADAKVTGRAVLLDDEAASRALADLAEQRGWGADAADALGDGRYYRVALDAVVVISVADDLLVIDRWTPGDGRVTVRRQ